MTCRVCDDPKCEPYDCCGNPGCGPHPCYVMQTLRLNAAAPDLLDACKWLVAYHAAPGDIVTFEEYLRRARAAIAKAEVPC